jgi:hypothetical protein
MRVFLAGIMQGSNAHDGVHAQDYRAVLAGALAAHVPGVEVFDPWAVYPDSPSYPDDRVRTVLVANIQEAAACDLVIAYLPQASMGTALEMWEAWRACLSSPSRRWRPTGWCAPARRSASTRWRSSPRPCRPAG